LVPSFAGARLVSYSTAIAYVVIFLSLVLLERLSGQLSLAQLAFCAVGGAGSAHLAADAGWPWLVAVFAGALIAVPVGALLAIPAIRLSGLYLALASFGFALLMEGLFYGQSYMFAGSGGGIRAPRPSFAESDRAYYYLLLAFALGASVLVTAVRRAPLGRMLRAMADSPVALATGGMNVTAIKVVVFCLSAFLAGLGGALLGPVTGRLSSPGLNVFASLLLVVVLTLQARLPDIPAAFAAAAATVLVPAYLSSNLELNRWLPVLFGVSAVVVAMSQAAAARPAAAGGERQAALDDRRPRGPWRARLAVAEP